MNLTLHTDPVPLHVDATGTIRVGQSRVTLDVLLQYRRSGMTPDEIVQGLNTLTLADVHGALAYYFRHQVEIDQYLQKREAQAEQLRQEIESAGMSQRSALKSRVQSLKARGNPAHDSAAD